jgi:hypothetical protein
MLVLHTRSVPAILRAALPLCLATVAQCGGAPDAVTPPAPPPPVVPTETALELGRRSFDVEQFGGNGRTCVTCHMRETGTITLEAVAARLAADPQDALFRHDALDGGTSGTGRLLARGTIRVELTLPPFVTLVDNPSQRTIVVNRGVPSTVNSPSLDGGVDAALMLDLRDRDLQAQALGAIHGHAKGTVEPTRAQLDAIALFERTDDRFFSSAAIRTHAQGGPRPELPAGVTESEQRGRLFFLPDAVPGTKRAMCGQCHSGPNLNALSAFGATQAGGGVLEGARFATALVAEANANHDPVFLFRVDGGAGDVRQVALADPGVMLTDRQASPHLLRFTPAGRHPALNAGFFKTASLWNVRLTPPYFHDNSAKSLREVVDHYGDVFFKQIQFAGAFVTLTEQDRQDIVAFLMLL